MEQPVYFKRAGSLLTAHRPDAPAAQRLVNLINRKMGGRERFAPIDRRFALELEPDLKLQGETYYFPNEGQIDAQGFMDASQTHLEAHDKVTVRWGCAVADVRTYEVDGASFDHVFDCRGIGAKPNVADVRGVRGEIIWVESREVMIERPIRVMHPRYTIYVVPRPNNIYLVGASEIESEDRSPLSVRSALELLSALFSIQPAFGEARILHTETNLRPALPDNLPLIQQGDGGITRMNGLFRHGYLLAPAMVEEAIRPFLK